MSRTYRAKSGDRFWTRPRHYALSWASLGYPVTWSRDAATEALYWESDNPNRHGIARAATKADTRATRRADTRAELRRAARDPEHEYLDRERLYRGIIWNYD